MNRCLTLQFAHSENMLNVGGGERGRSSLLLFTGGQIQICEKTNMANTG